MGMQIPDIVGYPGKQIKSAYEGFKADKEYDEFVDQKIVVADLKPMLQQVHNDGNIYDPKDAWGEYEGDLKELDISPPKSQKWIRVAISNLNPITRSYNNNYGDSEILPTLSLLGPKMQEIITQTGFRDSGDLEVALKKLPPSTLNGLLGGSVTGYNKAIAALQNMATAGGEKIGGGIGKTINAIGDTAGELLKNPGSKIGWPQVWKNSSFEQSYELMTRLYCFSTDNEADYNNNIKACIGALELFVTPRSKEGRLYTSPYMLQFDIPGMLHFPIAYVSGMRVIEGGDEGDFAQSGRPNVVDVSISIQNAYNISVNTPKSSDKKYKYRPSVRKDLIGLATGKETAKYSSSIGDDTSIRNSSVSFDQAWDNANNQSTPQKKQEPQQGRNKNADNFKEAAKGLENPTIEKTTPESKKESESV